MTDKKTLGLASRTVAIPRITLDPEGFDAALAKVGTPSGGPGEFTPQKIVANKGPTLQFDGNLLIEYSTDPKRQKVRWTEFRLWETPSGAWIMETVGCSDDEAQVDIFDAEVFRGEVGERPIAVMDWLGWSYPARAIAKKLGWNLIVRID